MLSHISADQLTAASPVVALEKLLAFGLFILVIRVLYAFTLDPLREFKGPALAKFSPWWLVYHARCLRRSEAVSAAHEKYGSFVRISHNHISVSDPSAYKQVYSQKTPFLKGPFYDSFHQDGPTIFSARNNDFHHAKRKYLNPGFQPRALHSYAPSLSEDISIFKNIFINKTKRGTATLDFNEWSKYFSFDVISKYAFGKSFDFMRNCRDMVNLIDLLDKRGEAMQCFGVLPDWAKPLMKFAFFDPFWYEGLRAKSGVQDFGKKAVEERLENDDEDNPDLLSLLIHAKTGSDPLSKKEIISDACAFVIGGADAPSIAMTHFMDCLSRHPEVQRKIHQELDKVFPEPIDDDWVAPDSVVQDLPYLEAALRESQRLIPSSSTGLERVVPPGGAEVAGRFLPGGTLVSIPTTVVMHDANIYDRPHEYLPERWLGNNPKVSEHFHPFSVGARSCIGRNFAQMEMMMCLATLLKSFEFERVTKGPTEMREAFTLKPAECWVGVERRKL